MSFFKDYLCSEKELNNITVNWFEWFKIFFIKANYILGKVNILS